MGRFLRPGILLLILMIVVAQSGCVRVVPARLPDPPTEDLRSRMGRIGVTWKTSADSLQGLRPARGSCDGAGRGAVAGMLLDLKITGMLVGGSTGAGEGGVFLVAGFLGLGIGILPVAAIIGSLYGAAAASDPKAVDEAADTLRRAIDAREFSRGVAEAILDRARDRVDDTLVRLEPAAPIDGVETLLEVEPPQLILQGSYNVNPSLQLIVQQTVTLVRASDHVVLHRIKLLHPTPTRAEFVVWAKNDADLLKRTLGNIDLVLGERLLDELFLLHPLPENQIWKKGRP